MEFLTFIGLLTIVNGFLLDDKLPQYNRYGRSLVLVGGNLYDNNTEIYQAIVRFAVSIRGKLFFFFFFWSCKILIRIIMLHKFHDKYLVDDQTTIRNTSIQTNHHDDHHYSCSLFYRQMDMQSAPSILFSVFRISRCFV